MYPLLKFGIIPLEIKRDIGVPHGIVFDCDLLLKGALWYTFYVAHCLVALR